ncbi:hypothetical protein [Bacteroides cellulosilyticus]|nr:hypothetical protein [Bacteroides cellulosilyticus]
MYAMGVAGSKIKGIISIAVQKPMNVVSNRRLNASDVVVVVS